MKDSTGNLWENFKMENFSMFVGSEKKLLDGLKVGEKQIREDDGKESLINAVEIQDYLEQAPSDWDGLVNKAFAMKEEITPLQNAEVDNIKDEMEVLGPIRLTEVQEAQKAVINVARTMSDEGSIVLAGRGGDDFV